ncbi:MAG: NUDIX hydrolase [Theionarchaea archaeon]|nr:NUDIX hydrolase [Theionarchaea archaeon]MBU7001718.1 NUDIX hydrolase [Theionarchaea archaeon]MBU7021170.1 NUDIX hydrolase [Theionarchaea archaeon]MBU7034560.1 NUDIX hydrolase [Theionarchaea archaeon]MBU7040166.1 NUDIX hydrolase [Theionarchaea archaeon]
MANRTYPEFPIPAVGVILFDQGRVLIIKRAFEPSANRWSIPGGAVEVGESVRDAAKREVGEELGLNIELRDVVAVLDNVVYEGERIKYHYVLIDFWAEVKGGTLQPSKECLDVRWVQQSELHRYDLTPGAKKAIQKAFDLQRANSPSKTGFKQETT